MKDSVAPINRPVVKVSARVETTPRQSSVRPSARPSAVARPQPATSDGRYSFQTFENIALQSGRKRINDSCLRVIDLDLDKSEFNWNEQERGCSAARPTVPAMDDSKCPRTRRYVYDASTDTQKMRHDVTLFFLIILECLSPPHTKKV
jgi:hypothetical protein